jgi:hypothetical protein
VAAAGALVLVGVAVTAGVLLSGGGDASDPVRAVTSRPSLDWTYTASGDLGSVVGVGDDELFTLTGDGELAAIDGDGEERWTTSVDESDDAGWLFAPPDLDVVLVLASGIDDGTWHVAAYSRKDGRALWDVDGRPVRVAGDRVLLADDETLRRIDPMTGEEEWSVDIDGDAASGEEAVVVVRDGALVRLDPATGEERWTAQLEGGVDAEDYPRVTVVDSFVVFSNDADGAEAFDLASGDALWTADPGADGVVVGTTSRDQVYVAETDYESDEALVRIFDREGETDSFRSPESYFYGDVPDGGTSYLVDLDGRIYDEDYEQVGTEHEGSLAFVEGGLYELHDGRVDYFEFAGTEPVWTLDGLGESDELSLDATDGRVLVTDGDRLSSYS